MRQTPTLAVTVEKELKLKAILPTWKFPCERQFFCDREVSISETFSSIQKPFYTISKVNKKINGTYKIHPFS